MAGNAWVGQHSGKEDRRLVRISPYFFGQHGLSNIFYLPKLRELPATGLDFKAIVFDFGFALGTPTLGPLGTQKINLSIERPVLLWAIVGVSDEIAEVGAKLGFNVQVFHSHEGAQRQFFNKHVNNGEVLGNGTNPALFRSPYLMIRGDEITCEVKNLSSNPANPNGVRIQVVLYGGEFD